EIVVFADTYRDCQDLLKSDKPLLVKGKIAGDERAGIIEKGIGRSKKSAEEDAARKALKIIEESGSFAPLM
ncbi:MAG: hypothetical protein AB1297_04080, partial [bacterium]